LEAEGEECSSDDEEVCYSTVLLNRSVTVVAEIENSLLKSVRLFSGYSCGFENLACYISDAILHFNVPV
jgi:hypothetical protein